MEISVKFCASQRMLTQTDRIEMPLNKEIRVLDVIEYVKELYPELPLNQKTYLVTVNQEVSQPDRILMPNDRVSFVPHIGGG